jgi:hypothetical protein
MFSDPPPKSLPDASVFTHMTSILNSHQGAWPLSLVLPYPVYSPLSTEEKLPNIFEPDPKKKCKKVTACPHFLRKHYAKNMCNNCYHKQGRDKTAWQCEHPLRKHYAKGLCQMCYLKNYNGSKHIEEVQIKD